MLLPACVRKRALAVNPIWYARRFVHFIFHDEQDMKSVPCVLWFLWIEMSFFCFRIGRLCQSSRSRWRATESSALIDTTTSVANTHTFILYCSMNVRQCPSTIYDRCALTVTACVEMNFAAAMKSHKKLNEIFRKWWTMNSFFQTWNVVT